METGTPDSHSQERFAPLDGWRGISILLVFLGHLLPLGPKDWHLNASVGIAGVAIFFLMSGFLITNLLLRDDRIDAFLIRRFMRIVPLAWLATVLVLYWQGSSAIVYVRHLLFVANLFPIVLIDPTAHLWSLCVEVQFYAGVALLVASLGRRGLLLLPPLTVFFTVLRMMPHVNGDLYSFYRVDEILAGCCLALFHNWPLAPLKRAMQWLSPLAVAPAFLIASNIDGGWFNALRPYLGALMIGCSLYAPRQTAFGRLLTSASLRYLAAISYALYVIHVPLTFTWLGSGDKAIKYLKRPLLVAVTFALAHVSTYQFERRCIDLGRRWVARLPASPPTRGKWIRHAAQ
jgi:peptidoglycan/LPS O-acetylase OafA/YrhL